MEELNVKPGDTVIYHTGNLYDIKYKIAKVIKVTPTGRIRVNCSDCQYNKYGERIGKKERWERTTYISKATDELLIEAREETAIHHAFDLCRNVERSKLTYEQAVKIIEILEPGD